jgi:hypothetical protein
MEGNRAFPLFGENELGEVEVSIAYKTNNAPRYSFTAWMVLSISLCQDSLPMKAL